MQNLPIPALFLSLNKLQDQGNFEIQVSSNNFGYPDCLIKCRCIEISKKKRSRRDSLITDAEEWPSTRTDEKCANLLEVQRHGKVFVMNKIKSQCNKRESVRDVTTSDETISDSCELSTMAQK